MKTKNRFILFFLVFIFSSPTKALQTDSAQTIDGFWASNYQAKWLSQTQPQEWEKEKWNYTDNDESYLVTPGQEILVEVKYQNIGKETWYPYPQNRQVSLAIYKDPQVKSAPTFTDFDNPNNSKQFGKSYFFHHTWFSQYRIRVIREKSVRVGETGTFKIKFEIPSDSPYEKYREDISLAAGPYWIKADAPYSQGGTGDKIGAAHIWLGFNVKSSPIFSPSPLPTNTPSTSISDGHYNLELINKTRKSQGLPPYIWNEKVAEVAETYCQKLSQNPSLGHGGGVRPRLDAAKIEYSWAGENWCWRGTQNSYSAIEECHKWFMDEIPPNNPHEKNLLHKQYTHIGIGIVKNSRGTFIVQDFIRP